MNVDSAASSTSSGPGGPSSRAHRGAIASQACETCRSRKQKCDEARPKVSIISSRIIADVVILVLAETHPKLQLFKPLLTRSSVDCAEELI